jgi:hypothetical protein
MRGSPKRSFGSPIAMDGMVEDEEYEYDVCDGCPGCPYIEFGTRACYK